MKNIAVLGAKGFIGKNTVNFLAEYEEYKVFPVSREDVDLLNEEDVNCFIVNNEIDIIIHCANQGGTRRRIYGDNDVIGNNLKMFFNAERCVNDKIKMINFGSGAQYDKKRNLVKVKESDFGHYVPKDDYGYSKYVMSKYLRERNSNVSKGRIYNPIVFGMFGIGEDYTYRFISNAIIKNIIGLPITINQNVVFDYLYIKDYLRILKKMIDEEWTLFEFNLTPTESISLVEIAELINQVGKTTSEIIIKNEGLNYQYTGDNRLLLDYLDQEFQFTPYIKSIEEMYKYYVDHLEFLDLEEIKKDKYIDFCSTKKNGL